MSKDTKKKDVEKKVNNSNRFLPGYLYNMSCAPKIGENTHWFQMLPISIFTAVIIILTRMVIYERPMSQFFWSGGKNQLTDFFSYYKMQAIIICAVFVLVLLLYRVFSQSFSLKRSFAYIPMIIYTVFVLLSYATSDYKIFALWGWNDRFEGTLSLLGYMIVLFYVINTIRTERDVKWVVYPLAVTSALLGILGLTQALDHDFFRTDIGKKLLTPSWFWKDVDSLNFTFQNKEIYQTVYNINYVSFYLTLLIPLFGMIFIMSVMKQDKEPLWRKFTWGALFTLLIFNLIGSASSGGLLGMAVVVMIGIIVLNKRIIQWWKPVTILLALTIVIAGISYERWLPELTNAIDSVLGKSGSVQSELSATDTSTSPGVSTDSNVQHKLDYMTISGDSIVLSFDGNEVKFKTFPDDPIALQISDSEDNILDLAPTNVTPIYKVNDPRFKLITVRPAQDESSNHYFVIGTNGDEWPFMITADGPKYLNGFGKIIDLRKVDAIGWKNNQGFGSGRGYIWSRSIPLMKDTLILGHGADTFCIYFPHDDYVGKYNSGTFSTNINIVVDKPHNMYFDAIIGTGGISMLSLLVLWGIYIIQSFSIYRRAKYDRFITYTGVGIFLGICGFLVSGFVNDSTVSVMPMFYGLLGMGISINMMLKAHSNIE